MKFEGKLMEALPQNHGIQYIPLKYVEILMDGMT